MQKQVRSRLLRKPGSSKETRPYRIHPTCVPFDSVLKLELAQTGTVTRAGRSSPQKMGGAARSYGERRWWSSSQAICKTTLRPVWCTGIVPLQMNM